MLGEGNEQKLAAKRGLPPSYRIGQIFKVKPKDKWRQVEQNRKPLILEDAQDSEIFEKWTGSEYIRGWMCTAMFVQDKLMGFINLDSRTPGAFTEEHAAPLQTFANQAAVAIANARLFELEQKRRKNAEIIRQAATILTTMLDLPSLHEAILEWLYKIVPYNSATIFELEGEFVRISATRGLPNPEAAIEQTFPADNILCRTMSEMREPLIIEDCHTDTRFEKWGETKNVRGWMGVPLISRGQVIGYITLDSHTPGAFTQNDAIVAQTFAHQAATSLENSRLFTETKQRLEELEVVSRVSFALRAAHDTGEMLPILLEEIKTSMDTDSAAIWLYEFNNNELMAKTVSGQFTHLNKMNFKPGEGIVGNVYSRGTAQVILELFEELSTHKENENLFGETWNGIVVPLRTASETIGALAVALNTRVKVKSHHIRLITTLAEIAGNAIYRSSLYQQSEEQIQRLTTLRELDTAIASSLDLRLTLGILIEHLLNKMGVSAAAVLIFNSASQTLDYSIFSGFKNQKEIPHSIKVGDGVAGQILLSRRAFFIKDLRLGSSTLLPKWLQLEGFKSYYAVPLFSKGTTRGILETYFREPFSPSADWIEFIHMLAEQAVIAIDNTQLFENLQQSNQELSLAYDRTLEGWGKALELRDKETQGHTERVTALTLELALQMGVPEVNLLHIRRGCLLHDIGKMGVPDHILRKNGKLTEEELFEMRKHTQYAYDMINPIEYLHPALDIAYCHHEWWDGSGYPRGLKGEEIPLPARIFAVIDVWDALSSDRPYRKAWDYEKILEYIRSLSGKQFDPAVVDAFFSMIENESRFFDWK
jgi:putative nucleotidyltransferase with HDIG domain